MVDNKLVALLHVAQVLHRDRVGHAVPDGGLLFLQIGKAVNGRFGFEEIVHFYLSRAQLFLKPRSAARGPYYNHALKAILDQTHQSKSAFDFCVP